MAIDPKVLDAMVDAGCSAEQIVAAVKADLATEYARQEERRKSNAERQRRHRQNRNAMSQEVTHVTRDNSDVTHVTHTPSSSPSVSPTPLSTTPSPSQKSPPKGGPKKGFSSPRERAKAMALPDSIPREAWSDWVDHRFDRDRKPPSGKALQAWITKLEKMAQAGYPPAAVIAQSIEHNWAGLFEPKGGSYMPQTAQTSPQSLSDEDWRKHVRRYRDKAMWLTTICGTAPPDQPGCMAPEHILQEFGFGLDSLFGERRRA